MYAESRKPVFVAGVLALMLTAAPLRAQSEFGASENSSALYDRGCALLRAGDPRAAVEPLARAVARRPENAEYGLALAEAYLGADQIDEAQRLLVPLSKQKGVRERAALLLCQRDASLSRWTPIVDRLMPLRDTLPLEGLALLARALLHTDRAREAVEVTKAARRRFNESAELAQWNIRALLRSGRPALAMREIETARAAGAEERVLAFLAADAYFQMDRVLGDCSVRTIPDGEVGQFTSDGLLLERSAGEGRFLVCPPESAMYLIRRALDDGLDIPEAHLLYARIWGRIEKPSIGLALLDAHATVLRDACPQGFYEARAELALVAGDLSGFLKATNACAALPGADANAVLSSAFAAAAKRCNERGDSDGYRQFLHRLIGLQPDSVQHQLAYADALWNAEQRSEAAAWYRRVLEAEPGHAERRRIMARLAE